MSQIASQLLLPNLYFLEITRRREGGREDNKNDLNEMQQENSL